jgi:hypothetical protein
MYCLAFGNEPRKLDEAVTLLRRAFALGHAPPGDILLEHPLWRPLREIPDFQELIALIEAEPRRKRKGATIPRVLEPTAPRGPVVLSVTDS